MNVQRSLVLIKPDGLQRDLLGEVIGRFERKGLKIVGLKLIRLTESMLDEHYAHLADKPFFASIKEFMMQTPVVGIVFEGIDAIEAIRKLIGSTNPRQADAGTIRADLAMNVPSNLVHASDSVENATVEVKRFFKDEELFQYEKITDRYVFGEGV
ncbi:MAG: Nucleoside diphosphate kinase [Candidatus Uhrbacteria bacterium GW2011_GWF2_41_16]|uniref:Nucleoside diphosphate kinase n=2 Tax=Candidatus Uhriibacteriota TaxID=1752732 RepID=A0A0G0XNU1_9BACT|nr:MAG: Nucleoside diphosphate kinase [Candidatus Uhrbacteria bacterium GW2011_GWA2_41_10]KKR87291.1 MAG: Nucleoside diphosphate kinase [Candidatus Uhrbacteria bacterium GW2011_GWC2_41_11]KKR98475.1 MAG: Nucleoside diphosphate kinase [Candidatus Uhrbacteria bacterium GW2011_GWF2_41_16]HBO99990.1 nucleoside-diphosphate kinase [Candidatus Uhrbacteria bacterium]